jgi:hypothetical protein
MFYSNSGAQNYIQIAENVDLPNRKYSSLASRTLAGSEK